MQSKLASQFYILLKSALKRFALLIALLISLAGLFAINSKITSLLPGPLWNLSGAEKPSEALQVQDKDILVKLEQGDNLSKILHKQSLPHEDISNIIEIAKKEPLLKNLPIGQELKFRYNVRITEQPGVNFVEEKLELTRLSLKLSPHKSVEFVRKEDGTFEIYKLTAPVKKLFVKYDATIKSNLISALQKTKLPSSAITKLASAYSYQLDLQRQIKQGDKIHIIAEKFTTETGQLLYHGKILYAALNTQGQQYKIYLFSSSGKPEDEAFFAENGQSVRRSLLKTPIDVVRISSHFGYRDKHPVLGFGAMHKGVDFSASPGTPIYASGDGVIQFIGWKSGYGRFIIIKHSQGIATAYAHASKFAKDLSVGSKVKQGQIIAYVGNSGNTTGPHLHYEIRVNGVQVNPLKFKTDPGSKLSRSELEQFNITKGMIHNLDRSLEHKEAIEGEKIDANIEQKT